MLVIITASGGVAASSAVTEMYCALKPSYCTLSSSADMSSTWKVVVMRSTNSSPPDAAVAGGSVGDKTSEGALVGAMVWQSAPPARLITYRRPDDRRSYSFSGRDEHPHQGGETPPGRVGARPHRGARGDTALDAA